MKPGTVINVTAHVHPHLKGQRRVVKTTTRAWCIGFPPGYVSEHDGSWLQIPRARDITVTGNVVVVSDVDGRELMTFEVDLEKNRQSA